MFVYRDEIYHPACHPSRPTLSFWEYQDYKAEEKEEPCHSERPTLSF